MPTVKKPSLNKSSALFTPPAPRPWSRVRANDLSHLRGVCLDIDDTLSTDGKLTAQAYAALWSLKEAGYWVVPVTGRPAGWCDLIARFWPVDAVVGENGAFVFEMRGGKRVRRDTLSESASKLAQSRIQGLKIGVKNAFKDARWASDQAYREYDLAIDFCEDVKPWSAARVRQLVQYCEAQGAHAKVSSIHVNAWFGDYDKASGLKKYLAQTPSAPKWDQWIFIGDSPNDSPLFGAFEHSVGVANVKRFLKQMPHAPCYITEARSGEGFVEFAKKLIALRHTRLPQKRRKSRG